MSALSPPGAALAQTQSATGSAALAATPPAERSELRQAAEAFEAIFVRKLLATARATDFGGEELFGGPGLEQFETMRDEHFADIASQNGTFGLADAIERQLAAFGDGTGNTP